MQISIKLEGNEKSRIVLPVLPENFEISGAWNNSTLNINSYGEVNMIGKRNLKAIPISSFFPKQYNASYVSVSQGSLKDPYTYVKEIQRMQGKICRLVITSTNINMLCTIEGFTYSEKDGTGDVDYTIDIKEYRNPYARSKKQQKSITYVCKTGDTLKKIAKKKLGSASKANSLYKLNKKKLTKVFANEYKKKRKKNTNAAKKYKRLSPLLKTIPAKTKLVIKSGG